MAVCAGADAIGNAYVADEYVSEDGRSVDEI